MQSAPENVNHKDAVPPPPEPLSPALSHLKQFKQFIVWKVVPDPGRPKPKKMPADYRNAELGVNYLDPQYWTDYLTAATLAAAWGDDWGVGFVTTREARVAVLDYDNALQSDGKWHPTVGELYARIPKAAIEISHSGVGAHNWCVYQGELPANDINSESINGIKVELFLANKFIALGNQETARGDASTDYTAELTQIISDYFPRGEKGNAQIPGWNEGHQLNWVLPGVGELIERAKRMTGGPKAAFGKAVSFLQLFDGDEQALGRAFPDGEQGRTYDESRADFALANWCSWLTGNDCPQIEEIMRKSALARDKWDKNRTYLRKFTIRKALCKDEDFFNPNYPKAPTVAATGQVDAGTTPGAQSAPARRKLKIIKVSEVDSEPIDWAWEDWLPKSMLTLYAGMGGVGKSTVTLNIAAALSNGGKWPDGTDCPKGRVAIWSGEDVVKYTIRPRLEAMGANLDMIDVIAGVEHPGSEQTCFDPARDGDLLHEAYGPGSIALLIVDPLISMVAGDMNQSNEVRRSLQWLVDFAEKVGCAVIGLAHVTKGSQGKNPVERILGSGAFGHVARMVWLGGQHEKTKECAIAKAKTNIVLNAGGFKYKIEPRQFLNRKGQQIKTTGIHWLEAVEGSAREILEDLEPDTGRGGGGEKLQRTKDAFLHMLANGPRPMTEVEKGLPKVSDFTIKRARKELGIVSNSIMNVWYVALPDPVGVTKGLTHQVLNGKICLLPERHPN
jgi:putative DNA primase/helicase